VTTALPPIDPVTGRTWPQPNRRVLAAMARHGRAWHADGACTPDIAHLFYGPSAITDDGRRVVEDRRARAARVAEAKLICASCPVLTQCRAYALDAGEPYGIWGGLTEGERDAVRRVHRHRAQVASPHRTSPASPRRTATGGAPNLHRRS
jgi:WhiB family redox-sensing transcriptional regulator